MTYSKGDRLICIDMNPPSGKRPALIVGEGNRFEKVATFGNAEKAELFKSYLEYFFGNLLVTETEKYWERRQAESTEGEQ